MESSGPGWWRRLREVMNPPPVSPYGLRLLDAAVNGDLAALQEFLEPGALPDQVRTSRKETALWLAVREGHRSVVNVLLAAGADPAAEDCKGVSPLTQAAAFGRVDIVEKMRETCPQALVTEEAARALRLAALNGHAQTVRELLEAGTPVDARPSGYPSALFAAAICDSACLAELLDAGADPREVDEQGQTALHHAAAANQLACVRMLLAAGADPEARSRSGSTPLDLAALDVVRRLLPPRAPPPADDQPGPLDALRPLCPRPLSWP